MRIIGVDCGSEKTGYGVIDTDGKAHRLVEAGVIAPARAALEHRLVDIASSLRECLRLFRPEAAAVEEVFHGPNVKTLLKLSHVRGVVLLTLAEAGIPMAHYSPLAIKQSVVGYGHAEKEQVQRMVASLLNLNEEIRSQDAGDALAAAICHATHHWEQTLVATN